MTQGANFADQIENGYDSGFAATQDGLNQAEAGIDAQTSTFEDQLDDATSNFQDFTTGSFG